jgi:hypothetical protein
LSKTEILLKNKGNLRLSVDRHGFFVHLETRREHLMSESNSQYLYTYAPMVESIEHLSAHFEARGSTLAQEFKLFKKKKAASVSKFEYCLYCDKKVSKRNQSQHSKGKRHKKNLRTFKQFHETLKPMKSDSAVERQLKTNPQGFKLDNVTRAVGRKEAYFTRVKDSRLKFQNNTRLKQMDNEISKLNALIQGLENVHVSEIDAMNCSE